MKKIRIARLVSTVGHPFVMIVLLVLFLSWATDRAGAWRITAFVTIVGLIPTGWLVWRRLSVRGNQTEHASKSSTRSVLYLSILAVLSLSSLYFYFGEHSVFLARGSLVTAMMVVVAMVFNRWIKFSLHLAFAVYSGLVLAKINPGYGLPILLLLVPLLAWSRLTLSRHTLAEVIGGAFLGLGTALALISLWPHA